MRGAFSVEEKVSPGEHVKFRHIMKGKVILGEFCAFLYGITLTRWFKKRVKDLQSLL